MGTGLSNVSYSCTEVVIGPTVARAWIKLQSNSTTLLLDNSIGVLGTISAGQNISSPAIPASWRNSVSSYNSGTYTLTLTNPIPTLPSYTSLGYNGEPTICFSNAATNYITLTNTNTVSNSTTINFTSTSTISVGMILSCTAVPYYFNCYVSSITNSTTIVVSSPVTISASTSISFTQGKIYNLYGYSSNCNLTPEFGHCYFSATRIA